MDRIVVTDLGGFDGEYPLDLDEQGLNNAELHIIKRIAGIRLGEIAEAVAAQDNDMFVCLTIIAVRRSGRFDKAALSVFEEALWEAPAGAVTYHSDDEGDAEGPPAEQPPSDPDSSGTTDESSPSSSETSSDGSTGSQETDQSLTGPRLSEVSAA